MGSVYSSSCVCTHITHVFLSQEAKSLDRYRTVNYWLNSHILRINWSVEKCAKIMLIWSICSPGKAVPSTLGCTIPRLPTFCNTRVSWAIIYIFGGLIIYIFILFADDTSSTASTSQRVSPKCHCQHALFVIILFLNYCVLGLLSRCKHNTNSVFLGEWNWT